MRQIAARDMSERENDQETGRFFGMKQKKTAYSEPETNSGNQKDSLFLKEGVFVLQSAALFHIIHMQAG